MLMPDVLALPLAEAIAKTMELPRSDIRLLIRSRRAGKTKLWRRR